MNVDAIGLLLFGFLKQMDAEATTITEKGQPTGLSDYGRNARQDISRPQTEVEWSTKLAELLRPQVQEAVGASARSPSAAVDVSASLRLGESVILAL